MTRTPSRTRTRTTRSTEHAAHRPLMHSVHIALWLKIASCVSSHPCMRTCVFRLDCFLLACLFFLPRLTVLLPALPDVHLSAQREVHVQPPVRLPLGERGHFRLRHTPHKKEINDALSLSEEQRSLSSEIFNILGSLITGEPLQILYTSGSSGFEAWRKLSKRYNERDVKKQQGTNMKEMKIRFGRYHGRDCETIYQEDRSYCQ